LIIAVLSGRTELLNENGHPRSWKPFFQELHRLGYVEGQNLSIERYSGDVQPDLPDLARQIVATQPDVIFVVTGRLAAQLKSVTTTIPIVAFTADPVALGITRSLARPGENLTGVVVDAGAELDAKRLQLVRQIDPKKIGRASCRERG